MKRRPEIRILPVVGRPHQQLVYAGLAGLLCATATPAGMTSLPAVLDTSIYDTERPTSNGAGEFLFAGTTGPNGGRETRRALLAFDVASMLPPHAVIESAALQVVVTRSPLGASTDPFTLHRALSAWGEGTSDPAGNEGQGTSATPGDATWLQREYPGSPWITPGGDFVATPSAIADIGTQGLPYLITGPGLIADIQLWLSDPMTDFGWFLLGDEPGSQTARQFGSRVSPDEDSRPMLQIQYRVIPEPTVLGLLAIGVATLSLTAGRVHRREDCM